MGGALPLALSQVQDLDGEPSRIDVRVAIPYHHHIDQKYKKTAPLATYSILTRSAEYPVRVFSVEVSGVRFYLVDAEIIHRSPGVYSPNTSEDGYKFTLFCLAVLRLLDFIRWKPDLLHVNDWHTSLAAYLNNLDSKKKIPFSILTLHNLPFMGAGTESSHEKFQIPPSPDPELPPWGRNHPLPMGLSVVDKIVPVSPRYAQEIQTPQFGCGLNEFLKKNRVKIQGILNGIDIDSWDPGSDPIISAKFDPVNLHERVKNKIDLQREFSLPTAMDIPLLILVSRMDLQKGIDIALQSLQDLGDKSWQAIILGSGDPLLEKACLELQKKYKNRVRAVLKFDSNLSHRMYAGGDILLMPSRYEPCGLSQLIAMRYGCIPVATSTGGLKNTIINSPRSSKTGYLVREANMELFTAGLANALLDFSNKPYWEKLQRNAMGMDFSWRKSALEYGRLYRSLLIANEDTHVHQ